jgi:hypothetical protein
MSAKMEASIQFYYEFFDLTKVDAINLYHADTTHALHSLF